MQTFAERIQYVAESSSLSDAALGELAGKGSTYIYLLRKERLGPSLSGLVGLCRVTGVSLDWLAMGVGLQPSAESIRRATLQAKYHFDLNRGAA